MSILLALVLGGPAQADSVDIITSQSQPAQPLDRAMVRAIFSVRLRQWQDRTPIRVFVLPDNDPLHVQFCREKLGTFPYVLRASWDRLLYTGTGIVPEVVSNERAMRARVAATPGAIGYVSSAGRTGSALPVALPSITVGDIR